MSAFNIELVYGAEDNMELRINGKSAGTFGIGEETALLRKAFEFCGVPAIVSGSNILGELEDE